MSASDDFSHSFFLVFLCSGRVLYDECAIFLLKKLNYFSCKKQHVDWLVGDLPYLTLWNPSFVFGKPGGMWLFLPKGILIHLLWWQQGSAPSFLQDKWEAWKGGCIRRPWGPALFPTVPSSASDSLTLALFSGLLFPLQASCARVVFQKTGHVKSVTHALLIWKTDEWKGNQNFSSILWSKLFFFK